MAESVILYVGTKDRLDPTTQVINATATLAPNGGTYEFTTLVPGLEYNVWAKLTGPGGTERVLSLGKIQAGRAPTVGPFSLIRCTLSPETELVLQVTVSDVV